MWKFVAQTSTFVVVNKIHVLYGYNNMRNLVTPPPHCSYTEGCPQDEFGDSSVVHMLTGWIPFNLKTSPPADTWNTLTGLLPLWKRPPEQDSTENADQDQAPSQAGEKETSSPPTQDKYIIMGSFSSWCPSPVDKPLTASAVHEIVRMKRSRVL